MTKLNQIVAIEKDVKAKAVNSMKSAYELFRVPQLLSGISRPYRPSNEEVDNEKMPGEEKIVQVRAENILRELQVPLVRLFDVVASKDCTNAVAKGTVKIGEQVIAENVPV